MTVGLGLPLRRVSVQVAKILKSRREMASSRPITANNVVVRGPWASYSARTSTVAAGAVAEDKAPKIRAVCRDCVMRYMPAETKKNVPRASKNRMEKILNIHIEKLPEGVYLATSDDVQGLVAQGRTVSETIEIARDVAKKLLEEQGKGKSEKIASPIKKKFDYPLIVGM